MINLTNAKLNVFLSYANKYVFPAILGCYALHYPAPAHDLYAGAKSVEAILWMEWHTLCGLYLVVRERKNVRHLSDYGSQSFRSGIVMFGIAFICNQVDVGIVIHTDID